MRAQGSLSVVLVLVVGSCGSTDTPAGPTGGQGDAMVGSGGGAGGTAGADAGGPATGGAGLPVFPDASSAPEGGVDAPLGSGGAGDGGAGQVGPDGPGGGLPNDAGGVCTAPYGPLPACTPLVSGMSCDPVCQTGCGCGERCRLESGRPVCHAEGPTFLAEYAACEPRNDRCRPGTICLQESPDHPACGARCYRHCRADSDCPNARCSVEVQFGSAATTHKICSPPRDACNPFGTAACSPSAGRAPPVFGCYVMSSAYPDTPICDCAGTVALGQPCMYEHECVPGAECVLAGGIRQCRRVCKVGLPAMSPTQLGGCGATPMICNAFPGSSQFGYCR